MIVLTTISDSTHMGFFRLKTSCALQNLDLTAITCHQDDYKNFRSKDDLLKNFIDELDEEEIVLFTDGYDALFLADEKEILTKFREANTSLLFSAEADCYPDKNLVHSYPPADNSIYKYLNSGGYIGKAGLIKKMLSEDISDIENNFIGSNQYLWTIRYLRNQNLVKLDTGGHIFSTFSNKVIIDSLTDENQNDDGYNRAFYHWFQDNYKMTGGRIYNKLTDTWPCHAHFNGQTVQYLNLYTDWLELLYNQIPGSKKLRFHQAELTTT